MNGPTKMATWVRFTPINGVLGQLRKEAISTRFLILSKVSKTIQILGVI